MSMSSFRIVDNEETEFGRIGHLSTSHGTVDTPAFFPVLDFIGGTTVKSGGIWSRVRNRLFETEEFNGSMYQAMSFLNFGITPGNLDDWRKKTLHEHFTDHDPPKPWHGQPASFTSPLFVDSGGYRLMQTDTFQVSEDEEVDNEWGLGTKPKSILELQRDYGADVIATLDFPIPKTLNATETQERIEQSIDSAIRTLELLDDSNDEFETGDWDPAVYIAVHGHNHDHINQYISKFLSRVPDQTSFDGFAIGSLVPLRSNIDVLVDIVQGAVEAIPADRQDDLGLHVFGISGKLFALLALLGVDSFDSNTYIQTARNRQFIHPETWERVGYKSVDEDTLSCSCQACSELDVKTMRQVMGSNESFTEVTVDETNYLKSDFYAIMAHHNYLVYEREIRQVRDAINASDRSLLDHVIELAANNDGVREGLQAAQVRDNQLRELVHARDSYLEIDLHPSNVELTKSGDTDGQTTSLKHKAADYNVLDTDFQPDPKPVLLVVPCSRTKPYSDSATHRAVDSVLEDIPDDAYAKLTVSGLFGPVPEAHETIEPITSYDYVLNDVDDEQKGLVVDRLSEYLDIYGNQYAAVIGYVTSKQYREAIRAAFDGVSHAELYPTKLPRRHIQQHFRAENLDELHAAVKSIVSESSFKEQSEIDSFV